MSAAGSSIRVICQPCASHAKQQFKQIPYINEGLHLLITPEVKKYLLQQKNLLSAKNYQALMWWLVLKTLTLITNTSGNINERLVKYFEFLIG